MSRAPGTFEIAQKATLHRISEVALEAGVRIDEIEPLGEARAKVSLTLLKRLAARPPGKLIAVTSATPDVFGSGKTVVSIALAEALSLQKKKTLLCLPDPSLGAIFSGRLSGTGRGRAQILPPEELLLHGNGDRHALSEAHNLLSAFLENRLHHGAEKEAEILWRRVSAVPDRQLEKIQTGLLKRGRSIRRESGFGSLRASELLSAVSASDSYCALRDRLSRIVVAFIDDQPVTVSDLGLEDMLAALLRQALKPNLAQTLGGIPAFLHGGGHPAVTSGAPSATALAIALKLAHYTVAEIGPGCEQGLKKFIDLDRPSQAFFPAAVVVVVNLRGLKRHAPDGARSSSRPADRFAEGLRNLEQHLQWVRRRGLEPLVAVNGFAEDHAADLKAVTDALRTMNAEHAVCAAAERGGEGALELAEKTLALIAKRTESLRGAPQASAPADPESAIQTIAREELGAASVVFSENALKDLARIRRLKWASWPVNIVKTPLSISDDAELAGLPSGWKLRVHSVVPAGSVQELRVRCQDPEGVEDWPERLPFESIRMSGEGLMESWEALG